MTCSLVRFIKPGHSGRGRNQANATDEMSKAPATQDIPFQGMIPTETPSTVSFRISPPGCYLLQFPVLQEASELLPEHKGVLAGRGRRGLQHSQAVPSFSYDVAVLVSLEREHASLLPCGLKWRDS